MINEAQAGNTSAEPVQGAGTEPNGGNGSGNGHEWIGLQSAAHLAGVTERAMRKWAAFGTHDVIGKKNDAGTWEIRRDTVPANGRAIRPGRPSGSRNEPALLELFRTLTETQKQLTNFAARNGWLESEAARAREIETRLLPAAQSEADQARAQLVQIRRRDRRLVVELVTLAVVAVGAVLI
jgi:hypothetical protein